MKKNNVQKNDKETNKTNRNNNKSHFINKFFNGKKNKIIFLGLSLLFVVLIITVSLALNEIFATFKSKQNDKQINIPINSNISQVSNILKSQDIINNSSLFNVYSKIKEQSNKIKTGTFLLHKGMSYNEILLTITDSSKNLNKSNLVIKEGDDIFSISDSLKRLNVNSDDVLKIINDPNVLKNYKFYDYIDKSKLSNAYYAAEGFIYPDTFHIDPSSTNPQKIADMLLSSSDKQFSGIYDDIQNAGLDFYEVMTIASIIQTEAGNVDDMPNVSSVIHNRLNNLSQYPKLESDPTRKYAEKINNVLGNNNVGDKYNTYITIGLPVGPICNPGIDAIKAAIHPANTEYFYFCSNVNTKQTYFASTLEEHNQNLVKAGIK